MAEEIKFEKALEKLEKIVEDLENGDLALEDALKKYEEGIRLSALCQQRLTQAEKKIEILTRSLDGSLQRKNFEFEEGEDETSSLPKKKGRSVSREDSKAEGEDVLL